MPKHGGCFLCGSTKREILKSVPLFYAMQSVALCDECRAQPAEEIKARVDSMREAMKRAREHAQEAR